MGLLAAEMAMNLQMALGQRRAESVVRSLTLLGAQPAQLEAVSFGKERPIAQGSNEDSWARNRNGHTAIASGAQ